jgi:hypothetical protein
MNFSTFGVLILALVTLGATQAQANFHDFRSVGITLARPLP